MFSALRPAIYPSSLQIASCQDGKCSKKQPLVTHKTDTRGETSTDIKCLTRLINYTPQAVMIRLITTNAINAYLTSAVLSLAGGFQDPRLLLPGWIGIATVCNPPPGYITMLTQ